MYRRSLLAGAAALGAASLVDRPARAQAGVTEITFWHGLAMPLGGEVERVCQKFNESQTQYRVNPVFKGSYPETLAAAIAAWRAGQAPNIVQMYEVGTGSMLAAGPAVKQVWQLFEDAGVPLDTEQYLAGVRGYYSLADGRLASMPFNSSTTMAWYNKDAFEKAGLDPEKFPATWQELVVAARTLKEKSAAPIAFSNAWPTWVHFEQFSAIHNLPFATLSNGFEGLGAELKINSPAHVRHLQRIVDMTKEGSYRYGGRDNAAEALFPNGEAAILMTSSGYRARVSREARFKWGVAMLPYDTDITQTPINSVIGGASLWAMTAPARKPEEYRAVVEFFRFISKPENDAEWHQRTGYLPLTAGGFEETRRQGYYEKNPGADLPIRQLTRGEMTPNSRGFRLGRFVEIRNIIQEEMEKTLQGNQTPQSALDSAVQRGNRVLREFERSNRG